MPQYFVADAVDGRHAIRSVSPDDSMIPPFPPDEDAIDTFEVSVGYQGIELVEFLNGKVDAIPQLAAAWTLMIRVSEDGTAIVWNAPAH